MNVLDVNSLRHLRFRAVAVVGLAERSFPSPPSPDPILLDDEREKLNAKGPAPIPLRVRGADPEPLQFVLATYAAGERLLVQLPAQGLRRGSPAAPLALLPRAGGGGDRRARPRPGHRRSPPRLALRARVREPDRRRDARRRAQPRRSTTAPCSSSTQISAAPRSSAPSPASSAPARHDRARWSPSLTEFDGVLGPEAREKLAEFWDPAGGVSPSMLEGYANCPQSVFIGNVIRAREDDEPETTIRLGAGDRGTLLHRVLELFLAREPTKGEERIHGPGEEERLLAIADEVFDEFEARGVTGYPAIWAADRLELIEDLKAWLANERRDERATVLTEGAYEIRFGYGWGDDPESDGGLSSDDPLEIKAGKVRLNVCGPDRPPELGSRQGELPRRRLQDRRHLGQAEGRRPRGRPLASAPDLRARRGADARDEAHPGRGRVPLLDAPRRLPARALHRRRLRRAQGRPRADPRRDARRDERGGVFQMAVRERRRLQLLRRRPALPDLAPEADRAQGEGARQQARSSGCGRSSDAARRATAKARRPARARGDHARTSARTSWSRPAPAPARRPRSSGGSSRSSRPATRPSTSSRSSPSPTRRRRSSPRAFARGSRSELEEDERDAAEHERLAAAIRGLYRARIETIHAYATALLRERPVEARLDPEFRAARRARGGAPVRPALRRLARRAPRRAAWPEIETAVNLGLGPDELKQAARLVHSHRYLLPLQPFEVEPGRARARSSSGSSSTLDELEGIAGALQQRRARAPRADPEGCSTTASACEIEGTSPAALARLSPASMPEVKGGGGRQSDWDDAGDCQRWKRELVKDYQELRERVPIADALGRARRRPAADRGLRPRLRGAPPRRGPRRLRRPDHLGPRPRPQVDPRSRGYFRRRFKALLIDEFQDTDPIQVELAMLLASEDEEFEGWRDLDPVAGQDLPASATRSSRSTASAAPTSASTTR